MACSSLIFSLMSNFMTSSKLGIKQLMPYLCCGISGLKTEIKKTPETAFEVNVCLI